MEEKAAYEGIVWLIARKFAQSGKPNEVFIFDDLDVNDVAEVPLSANRCIRVTLEYADIPDQTLEEMLETVTDENRPGLVDFGKPVGKEQI